MSKEFITIFAFVINLCFFPSVSLSSEGKETLKSPFPWSLFLSKTEHKSNRVPVLNPYHFFENWENGVIDKGKWQFSDTFTSLLSNGEANGSTFAFEANKGSLTSHQLFDSKNGLEISFSLKGPGVISHYRKADLFVVVGDGADPESKLFYISMEGMKRKMDGIKFAMPNNLVILVILNVSITAILIGMITKLFCIIEEELHFIETVKKYGHQ